MIHQSNHHIRPFEKEPLVYHFWLMKSEFSSKKYKLLFSLTYIYFPLSYYMYNSGSSVSVPGRPSWRSLVLFSKMVRKREATAFCSISHFENICLYSMFFSVVFIVLFSFGHSRQCICVSSLLKHRGHRLSFWLNDLMLDLIFDNVFDLSATNNDDSSKLNCLFFM